MEMVLDVYKRPIDPLYPVVCMDESPKQLIAETEVPIPASPGEVAKHDYEYRRCGVCNIFLACEPLAGKRMVKIAEGSLLGSGNGYTEFSLPSLHQTLFRAS